jgi:hypothetical protein
MGSVIHGEFFATPQQSGGAMMAIEKPLTVSIPADFAAAIERWTGS